VLKIQVETVCCLKLCDCVSKLSLLSQFQTSQIHCSLLHILK